MDISEEILHFDNGASFFFLRKKKRLNLLQEAMVYKKVWAHWENE